MTQSREPNDRDLYTRVAALEYQLTEIQNTQAQLRATIAPDGYITDAFVGRRPAFGIRVVERISEVEDRLNVRMDEQFAEVNTKLDIIIRGMTGMGQE
jgi:hypothetical protein